MHFFQFTAVPLARHYFTGFSLQSCHSSDLMALVSVYSRGTGQTLFQWFQFAILMLVRLYFMVTVCSPALVRLYLIGFSLQSCHSPDLIYPGSVYNLLISALHCSSAIGQNILHQVQGVTWLARIYFIKSKVRPAYSYTIYIAKTIQRETPE